MSLDQDNDDGAEGAQGRFWIEILSWDWFLAVGFSSKCTPAEYRFQGGLNFVRSFNLWGRVLSPEAHRGDEMRIWISPFGKEMRFGPGELEEVGRVYASRSQARAVLLRATLLLPEDAAPPWRHASARFRSIYR